MAANRLNFMPPTVDPASNWDIRMRGIAGGDPRFFDYGRFGILNDTSTLKGNIEGPTSYPRGSTRRSRNAGMAPTSFAGGKTGDDPGGYNWGTLQRNLDRVPGAVDAVVNFRMENKRLAKARKEKQNEEFLTNASNTLGATYGYGTDPFSTAYSGASTQSAAIQAANQVERNEKGLRAGYGYGPDPFTTAYTAGSQKNVETQQATKSQSSLGFAKDVAIPSQNLEAGREAEANDLVPGSVSPIKGRKSRGVNILEDKKSSRRPGPSSPYSGPQPPAPPRP